MQLILYPTEDVSRVIGVGLSRLLGWKVDLKNPQVEVSSSFHFFLLSLFSPLISVCLLLQVNIHLSDDYCLMGIPLTRFLTLISHRNNYVGVSLMMVSGLCHPGYLWPTDITLKAQDSGPL